MNLTWPWRKKTRQEERGIEQTLRELGIAVVQEEKLKQRFHLMGQLSESIQSAERIEGRTPEEKMHRLIDQLQVIDQLLNVISIPYGRAAENAAYASAMQAWAVHHAEVMAMAKSVLALMEQADADAKHAQASGYVVVTPREQKEELFQKFHYFVVREHLKTARQILGASWSDKDVSERHVAVVQLPWMPTGGGVKIIEQGGGFGDWGAVYGRRALKEGEKEEERER